MLAVLRVAFCIAALMTAFGVAHAEGKVCTSILENGNECAELPRVTAKGNMRVEVVTRKRTVTFPLVPGRTYDEDYSAASCPDGKCACDEFVQYLDFKGPVPGYRQVNAFERAVAAKTKCSIENSNVDRSVLHFAVSAHFVSTAIYELEYCRNCGGSCHGHTVLSTYDAQTGRVLQLADAVAPARVGQLIERLVEAFVAANFEAAQRADESKKLLDDLSARDFKNPGIYVDNGVVFVNLDTFALSCASGSFFPVAVPAEFIEPALGALL